MIGYLSGQLINKDNELTINVNGVGYQVIVGNKIFQNSQLNQNIELYIYTHVKEDALELFGFSDLESKKLFKMVLNVSGVGPKTAIQIVDQGSQKLINAVQNAQVSFFKAIPRVGKKLAEKIIIELRGKLGEIKKLDLKPKSDKEQQIIDALLSLGFDESLVLEKLEELDISELSEQQVIKKILRKIKN